MFVKEAKANAKTEEGMHQSLFPHAVWISEELKDVYTDADQLLQRAAITKAKFMILTAEPRVEPGGPTTPQAPRRRGTPPGSASRAPL